eukprot:4832915-Pleurochrysis_carterae.AAC.1
MPSLLKVLTRWTLLVNQAGVERLASLSIARVKAYQIAALMPFSSRLKSATSAKKMRMDVALALAAEVLSE